MDTPAREISAATGAEGLPVAADFGDMDQIQAMTVGVRSRFGRIDLLLNRRATYRIDPDGRNRQGVRQGTTSKGAWLTRLGTGHGSKMQ